MKNERAWFWVLVAALALSVSAPRLMAEEGGPGKRAWKGKALTACKGDFAKFCKDVKPGGGRLIACLKEHERELTPECKTALEAKKEAFLKNHPCAADMQKLCKDLKGKKRMSCMKENEKDLSEACKAKRAERKGERKGKKERTGKERPGGPDKK